MPNYDPDHVEHTIIAGNVQIVLEEGKPDPAYWAYPTLGMKFPGVALIHDWWGLTSSVRRLANLMATMGHYVIVPDLFNGETAHTPQQAMRLVEALGEGNGYPRIHSALAVLERHNNCNGSVAAVGIGMGGSLAFEAALTRTDLEAAVAFAGFPQRFFGRFKDARAPILALYGEHEPHVVPAAVDKLRKELTASTLTHKVVTIPGLGHEFLFDHPNDIQREQQRLALREMFAFMDKHLQSAIKPKINKTK